MLALWTAVAREGPFGRFGQQDFVAYYLSALFVRTLTSSWVVWEMNQEIRDGSLSMRLLRPIHPFFAYAAQHMAAIPMRALVALPAALIMLLTTSGSRIVHDPVLIAALPLALAGAWLITFLTGCILGTLGMLMERSVAVWEAWLALFAIMSGYLIPIELMPTWIRVSADYLPFKYMLGFPVQLMIGMLDRATAARSLMIEWGLVAVLVLLAVWIWRKGIRRFEAYGA
jgi:ABC-2 type transport system permease protein